MNMKATDWKKIFTTHITHKGVVPRIPKDLLRHKKKTNNQWQKFEQILHKRRYTNGQLAYEQCTPSLIIRKMQI